MHILLQDIHKYYGALRANEGIDLEIKAGSIHGVVGENGAGKSTLMKILAGYVTKSKGTILVNKRPVVYHGPQQATHLGIGMLYQDPLDFPALSVLENFMAGLDAGAWNRPSVRARTLEEMAGHFDFHLLPHGLVRDLTVGERQQLELLRLLALGVETLILDEPTTGISSRQRETLFRALKKLAADRKTILLVSHKLEDIEALCDRITVLRRGKVVGSMERPFQTPTLIEWMFGNPLQAACRAGEPCQAQDPVLAFDDAHAVGGRAGLTHCRLTVQEGEVVGLAGMEGSGQELFLRLAAGMLPLRKGRVLIGQEDMSGRQPADFQARGVAFIPSARLEEGLVPGLSIREHFALKQKTFFISDDRAQSQARERIERFRIIGGPLSAVESLSGGNQQRLLLALLPEKPRLLLLENPTRGLDLESVQWVWQQLLAYRNQGATIVFSSPELDEIMQVADRILVFFNGRVVKSVKTQETSLAEIGEAISGK